MENLSSFDADLFAFFEMTPDLVCIAGKDGFFRKVNPAVINKLGYTHEELFASPISSFIHPADKEITSRRREHLLKGQPLLNFQNRYQTKGGSIIWLEWTSVYVPDKEIVFAIAKDITEKKMRENKVEEEYRKFKNLATHFKTSIEEDRKNFATELHEELAQLAVSIKMDVDWISSNTPDLPQPSKNRFDRISEVSHKLIDTIRRISFSMSPNMLDDIGLNDTLEWQCKEFSILTGIPCRFESNYDEASISREVGIDFFRICQESLANVMDHAQASSVKVSIEEIGDKIMLSIIDNGKGFDTDQQETISGLITMRERVTSINGQFTIDSRPGKGTTVSVAVAKQ
jgi:PAS domain S-box-containing protein